MERTMTMDGFLAELEAQGVPKTGDYAFRCVMCNTVQSMRSFVRAGATPDTAEAQVGFSCVGRHTDAGPWDPKDAERAKVPGCDWTIGGLFGSLGRGVVVMRDGRSHPRFHLATPAEAQKLAAQGGEPFRPERGA